VTAHDLMTDSVAFQLAKLGQLATARFVDRLEPLGLRPRHCAVLALLAGPPMSQLELANRIGVTPSVVGEMLDELQAIGAVRRIRDDADRRRQLTKLTVRGRATSARRRTQRPRQIAAQRYRRNLKLATMREGAGTARGESARDGARTPAPVGRSSHARRATSRQLGSAPDRRQHSRVEAALLLRDAIAAAVTHEPAAARASDERQPVRTTARGSACFPMAMRQRRVSLLDLSLQE